jgi:S-adenosylmethionine hydrolase
MNTTKFQPNLLPIISLTTDFGQRDGYVGAMQGVILGICPRAVISTISHNIPPQNIQAAAFALYQAYSYYPAHTVHCVVVDPGVGSKRRAVAIRTSHGTFVGPDNGVFSLILDAANVLEAVTLTNPRYQLPAVSATFHGRDIFAPAAAYIANGIPLIELGSRAINLVRVPKKRLEPFECQIIHIDHFGNLILDITAQEIQNPETVTFTLKDKTIKSLSYTFADVEPGQLLAYVGSSQDHIEIAIRDGNAAKALDLQWGDVVQVMQ